MDDGFLGYFLENDFLNLLSDVFDLTLLGIGCLSLLLLEFGGEGKDEDSEDVAVNTSCFDSGFNKSLSLFDHGEYLVSSGVETIETSSASTAFNIIDD